MKRKLLIYIYALSITAGLIGAGSIAEAGVVNAFTGKVAGAAKVLENEGLAEAEGVVEGLKRNKESGSISGNAVEGAGDEEIQNEAAEPQVLAAETTETEDLWGYTNLGIANVDNHLNIRETPDEGGKLVGKMSKNAACEILSIENNWAHIKSGKVEGYASLDFLFTGEEAKAKGREAATAIATVTTETLKVREQPSTDSVVLTLVPIEEELEVEQVEDGWVKILLDDESAYVSADYVRVDEKLDTAVTMTELLYGEGVTDVKIDLAQYAKQFIGNPYVWGGVSLTNGADCSGFVLSVYKKYGVSLPHSSRAQAGYGTKVDSSDLQPGDLIFYAKNGTINHVAIYVGGGQVVHASSPRTGIKISKWNYRTPHTIRRIIK